MSAAVDRAARLRDQAAVLAAARQYAERIAPTAAERDRTGSASAPELELLAASGLIGIRVPRAHGGPGVDAATLAEVIRVLARADPSIAQVLQPHYSNVDRLAAFGSDALAGYFYPRLLAGERFGNAVAERGGQHFKDARTRLLRQADGSWRLTGRKFYATGAITGEWIVTEARDAEERSLTAFVARGSEGVEVLDDWNAIGQRATASGTVVFNDVNVPGELVREPVPDTPRGRLSKALSQLIHVAIQVGIAEAALDDASRYVRERSRPSIDAIAARELSVSADPHVAVRAGQLLARVQASEALLDRVARSIDHASALGLVTDELADTVNVDVALARAFATDIALEVASELFALAGTGATDRALGLDRHWRNARTHSTQQASHWKYRHGGELLINGTGPSWRGWTTGAP